MSEAAATDPLSLARELILRPGGLDDRRLDQVFGQVLAHSVDFADLYFQLAHQESWSLEDGIVKDGSASIEQGVGVRALAGEKTGFAYSDEIILPALEEASRAARAIAVAGGERRVSAWRAQAGHQLYLPGDPAATLATKEKVEWLERVDRETRALDPRVVQVSASLVAVQEVILIATSEGELAADVRPLVRFNVSVLVEQNGRREQGYAGCGGRFSLAELVSGERPLAARARGGAPGAGESGGAAGPGRHHDRRARARAGRESCCTRPSATDSRGISIARAPRRSPGRIGEQVAAPECTVVDDGTLSRRRGSLNIDDEGTPTQCTTLIENGILKGYMQDRLNARLMGVAATGNGRRESFAHLTLPRMTNTYMRPGPHAPQDIIASVERGIYAVNFGGGQVDITSGKFVFSASEAYEIENGRVGAPLKGATLIGNGPDVLTRVTMVGNDLKLDDGVGTCGKEGQSVPVGVGQPTLRIDALTVGGTA